MPTESPSQVVLKLLFLLEERGQFLAHEKDPRSGLLAQVTTSGGHGRSTVVRPQGAVMPPASGLLKTSENHIYASEDATCGIEASARQTEAAFA